MKTRNAIKKLIAITIAVAALVAAGLLSETGWLQPVQAQIGDGSVKFVSYASVGIVEGEKVRLSVANSEESAGTVSLSFSYYLAHASNTSIGVPFYETEWMQVPRGEFRSAEVRHEDLKTEGEPETKRRQMLVRLNILAPAGSKEEDFTGALEVIKEEDQGEDSAQIDTKYRMVILPVKRPKVLAPITFKPGERLTYTFVNPDEEGSQTVRVTTYTYDSIGRRTAETAPVVLRPGEWYTTSINYEDLRVGGNETTVGSGIQVVLMDGSVRHVNVHVSMERVDNRTGITKGGTYFTGSVTVSGDG